MKSSDREQWLREQADAVARQEGCELLDLKIRRRGAKASVELTLDRRSGVSVDDCARVSRRLGVVLEEEDPIAGSYLLEVSSPGLTRRLTEPWEYEHFRGRLAVVETNQAVEGRRRFRGRLAGTIAEGSAVVVADEKDGDEVHLPWEAIAWGRLDLDSIARKGSGRRRKR